MKQFVKKNLLGVAFADVTEGEVLEYIIKNIQKNGDKLFIVTPNPELLVLANDDKNYKRTLNSAQLALADGIGIILAFKFLGFSLKEKITGIDLMESLCKEASKRPITVGFLGSGPKIAEKTAECLEKRYFGLKITFFGSEIGNFDKLRGTDILFVGFGSPKQEFWIKENLKRLPVKSVMGVGGAFDIISGKVGRAPAIMRRLGLEWLYRLFRQPWRAKRQLALIKFIFLVIKEKLLDN